ncbi:hypothetical protein Tco_0111408, partial [Tanacetum coccineum]
VVREMSVGCGNFGMRRMKEIDVKVACNVLRRNGKMHGFEVIVPGNANMEHTIIPSTEAKSRKDGVTRSIAPTRDGRIFSGLVELVVSGDGEAVEMVVKHCGCSDEGVSWG